jgi:hypothetical protein
LKLLILRRCTPVRPSEPVEIASHAVSSITTFSVLERRGLRTSPTSKEFLLFQGRPYKLVARQGALRALTMRDSVPEGER